MYGLLRVCNFEYTSGYTIVLILTFSVIIKFRWNDGITVVNPNQESNQPGPPWATQIQFNLEVDEKKNENIFKLPHYIIER